MVDIPNVECGKFVAQGRVEKHNDTRREAMYY
jgi:hypothetical protein